MRSPLSRPLFRVALTGFLLLAMLVPLGAAFAGEALCVRRFKKKRFVLAAKCFQRLADSADIKKSEEQRMKAGMWLRNAALAYKQAATKEKSLPRASYLRERGSLLLRRYLKGKMFRTQTQERIAKSMLDGLDEKIGYATLTILPKDAKAKVRVLGYRYKKTLVGGGAIQVRPGNYTVLVVFSDKRQDAKTVALQASTPLVLRFGAAKVIKRPPPTRALPTPARKGSPIGWIIAGVGGAIVLGGVVLLAVSVGVTSPSAEQRLSRAIEAKDPVLTREAGEINASASTQYIAGWIVSGVGVATLGTGVVIGAVGGGKAPAKTALHVPSTARALLATQ